MSKLGNRAAMWALKEKLKIIWTGGNVVNRAWLLLCERRRPQGVTLS
jgi:SLT domain-containing protein